MAESKKKEANGAESADEFLTFSLSSPIKSYGEEISVLKMRKPTGSDLITVGNPVVFYPVTDPPRIEHDMVKMMTMIATLSKVPSSSVESIGPRDLTGIAWLLTPFFLPAR